MKLWVYNFDSSDEGFCHVLCGGLAYYKLIFSYLKLGYSILRMLMPFTISSTEVKVVVVFDAMMSGQSTHRENFAGYYFLKLIYW